MTDNVQGAIKSYIDESGDGQAVIAYVYLATGGHWSKIIDISSNEAAILRARVDELEPMANPQLAHEHRLAQNQIEDLTAELKALTDERDQLISERDTLLTLRKPEVETTTEAATEDANN